MVVMKFRDKEEHGDLMKKVRKMGKFIEELEDMLEECLEDQEYEFRSGSYRKEYEEPDMKMEGRYGYRRGMR